MSAEEISGLKAQNGLREEMLRGALDESRNTLRELQQRGGGVLGGKNPFAVSLAGARSQRPLAAASGFPGIGFPASLYGEAYAEL